MKQINLSATPLSQEAFAPYGDVIEVAESNEHFGINYGLTERHHKLATVELGGAGSEGENDGDAIISIFRSQCISLPFSAKIIERHPLGSQAFMPLSGNPYLVLVGPAGDFDPTQLRAFLASPQQGVNYHRGTWHHYCLALQSQSDFLVVDRSGSGNNCDEVELADDLTLTINL